MSQLEVEGLRKTFSNGEKETVALDDVSFDVEPQEFVAILGPSGSGKTTLLRAIAGLVDIDSGSITYRGGEKLDRGDIGFVFQDYALFEWKTVQENLETAQKLSRDDASEKLIQEYLEMVGLEEFRDSYPRELSGGMKQRVAVARALIYDPDLVLMDEPFGALDEITKEELYSSFADILEETNKTVLYVTHDIEEAFLFADRMIVFSSEGKMVDSIDIELESPRTKDILETDRFFEVKDRVMEMIDNDEN